MSQRTPRRKRTPDTTKKRRGRVAAAACALAALALLAGTAAVAWAPAAAIATVAGTAQGDATLAGAVFKVTFTPGGAPAPTHTWYLDSVESGGQGKVVLDDAHLSQHPDYKGKSSAVPKKDGKVFLQYGDYTLEEVVAPVGYQLWQGKQTVSFATGTKVEFKDVEDKVVLGSMSGTKVDANASDPDADSHPPVTGAEFTIYNRSAKSVWVDGVERKPGDAVMSVRSAEDGSWSTGQVLPWGTYEAVESAAPDGYAINSSWTSGKVQVPARDASGNVTSHTVDVGECADVPRFFFAEGWKEDAEVNAQPTHYTGTDDVNIVKLGGGFGKAYQAIDDEGQLWFRGWSQDNTSGNGTGYKGSWTLVEMPEPVSDVVYGNSFGMRGNINQGCIAAIGESGQLYTWGNNQKGQLGHGDYTNRAKPTAVESLAGVRIVKVAIAPPLDDLYNTGLIAALDSNGQVWMAGSNNTGAFGLGTTGGSYTTFRKIGGSFDAPVKDIALSGFGTICVVTTNGSAYTCGRANGETSTNVGALMACGSLGNGAKTNGCVSKFVRVSQNGVKYDSVSGGNGYFVALTADGTGYGWGWNWAGQTGVGSWGQGSAWGAEGWAVFTPKKLNTSAKFSYVMCGTNTTWAIGTDHNLYGWGAGNSGEFASMYPISNDIYANSHNSPKRFYNGVAMSQFTQCGGLVLNQAGKTLVTGIDVNHGSGTNAWKEWPIWKQKYTELAKPTPQGSAGLAGATFTVYSDKACTKAVASAVTDEEGHWRTDRKLSANTAYWVKETASPWGYKLSDRVIEFRVEDRDVCVTSKPNTAADGLKLVQWSADWQLEQVWRGGIKGTKVDQDGRGLAGATFNVYNLNDNIVMVDRNGDGVGETKVAPGGLCLTTGASASTGSWSTAPKALPVGTYKVVEANPPANYLKSPYTAVVTIDKDSQMATAPGDADGGPWVNVLFRGGVAGVKMDAELGRQGQAQAGATLEGAEFTVFSWTASGNSAALAKVGTYKTDGTGLWKAEGLGAGNYVVVETKAPAGYELPEHKVDLRSSTTATVSCGAAPTNALVASAIGGTAQGFTVSADGETVTLFSSPTKDFIGRGGLSGTKVDAATGGAASGDLSLDGAEFTIYNLNEGPVMVDTDGDGVGDTEVLGKGENDEVGGECLTVRSMGGKWSTTERALPAGQYLVKETRAPSNYGLNEGWSERVTVAAGTVTALKTACANDPDTRTPGPVQVKAFAHGTTQGAATLAGAEFAVKNLGPGAVRWRGELVAAGAEFSSRLVTDAKGRASFDGFPDCTLELREVKAPAGLELNPDWRGTYRVTPNGVETLDAPCPDEGALYDLQVLKVDADGGAPLEGAVFEVWYDSDEPAHDGERSWSRGDCMASAVTGADGLASFSGLPLADYLLVEAEAPEGYDLAGPVEVKASQIGGGAFRVTVSDTRARGDLELVKVDETGAPMAGVPFLVSRVDPDTGAVIERHVAVTRADGRLDTAGRAPSNVNGNDRFLKADGTVAWDAALDATATVWFGPGTPKSTGALEVGSYVVTELAHRSNDGKVLVTMEREITGSWPTLDLDTVENAPVGVETSAHDEAGAAVQVVYDAEGRTIVDEVWVDGFDGEWGDRTDGEGELSWSLETRLMSVATGKVAVRADGTECVQRQRAVYTDEGAPQRVKISMEGLEPGSYVVFQRVIDADGRVVGSHEDWGAAEQTVTVARAELSTVADSGGSTTTVAGFPGAKVTDTVTLDSSFATEWKARGLLVDREAYLAAVKKHGADAVLAEAKRAMDEPESALPSWALQRSESDWTWMEAAGESTATVKLAYDLTGLVGRDVVCFETAYREVGAADGALQPIARHIDPDDPDQTLAVVHPLANMPSTGVDWPALGAAVACAAAGLAVLATVAARLRRRSQGA